MNKKTENTSRRTFIKGAVATFLTTPFLSPRVQANEFNAKSLQVWSCGGLAEAFIPANKRFEKKMGISIAYTGAFAAALGKSLLGSAETEVFAPRVLELSKKLRSTGKMLYFKPLCFSQYVVVTPKGNPASIRSIQDLVRPGVRVVLAPQASPPGGDAVNVIFKKAGIEEGVQKNTVIRSSCVQTMMDELISRKGDASVVELRLTRMERFAGKVDIISLPDQLQPASLLTFTIGVMKFAQDRELGDYYVNFICSEEGQAFFEKAGFIPAISEKGQKMIQSLGVKDV